MKNRIPSKNHLQYDSLRYVSDVAVGPTLHITFVVNKEQGYQLILRSGRYSVRPLGQTQSKKPVT